MKASFTFSSLALASVLTFSGMAADLKQSKFTQVINDVKIVSMPDKDLKTATVNDLFKMPDVLRTGAASRAELVAEDKTITRVGANTVFSFDSANRTIDLEKGSILFHSPKGKGGGQIKTGSATAAVLGTTIIVSTTSDGGFKLLVLEGTAKVTLPGGRFEFVKAGQEVFVLPNGEISPIIDFRLSSLIVDSRLVNGFDDTLPSIDKIRNAIDQQEQLIVNGEAQDTGLVVGDGATETTVEAVDPNSFPQNTHGHVATPSISPVELTEDVSIASPHLDDTGKHLFATPTDVTLNGTSGTFVGVFGRDINFVTGSETIDLFPFESLSTFTFLASRNININHSVDFFGSRSASLSLVAQGNINIASDITVSYDGPGFFLQSGNSMLYSAVSFRNDSGLTDLQTAAAMSLNGCSVVGGDVNLTASQNLTLNGGSVAAFGNVAATSHRGSKAAVAVAPAGKVTLTSTSGSINGTKTLFSGQTFSAHAAQRINLDSVSLGSFASVNLAARTLVLKNINFASGSVVTLRSENGLLAANPNTGAAVQVGYVNFVNNVNYGGQPAQNFIGSGITLSKLK